MSCGTSEWMRRSNIPTSMSTLLERYPSIEHAVRLVLDHLDMDEDVVEQTIARGRDEDVPVSRTATERVGHLLLDGADISPKALAVVGPGRTTSTGRV